MKKKVALVCAAILAAGVLAFATSCSQSEGTQNAGSIDSRVTYSGETLTVSLDENGTTGYLWDYEMSGNPMAKLSDEYTAAEGSEGVSGAGGIHVFEFQGTEPGTTTIEFVCSRSWEPDDSDERLTIEVKTGTDGVIESVSTK